MDRPPPGVGSGTGRAGARPTPGALALIVVAAFAFLLSNALDGGVWAARHLALHPLAALGRQPWQLATSAFAHAGFVALLFSALGIWIFGTPVERAVGARRMWIAFALSQLMGAFVVAALGRVAAPELVCSGAQLGVTGLIGAFGVAWAAQPVSPFGLVTLRGRSLALGLIAFSLLEEVWGQPWRTARVELCGTLVAALAGAMTVAASQARPRLGHRWQRWRLGRLRRRYRVISGGLDTSRRQLS